MLLNCSPLGQLRLGAQARRQERAHCAGGTLGTLGTLGTFTFAGALCMIEPMFGPPDQAADSVTGKKQRIAVSVPRELVERIDDFRWAQRLESRAEAIRRLLEDGLAANKRRS